MRTVKSLIDVIAEFTDQPHSRVSQMARRLIDDGLIPKSAGRHVKEVGSVELARLLCAVSHAGSVGEANRLARGFASLPLARVATAGGADTSVPDDVDRNWTFAEMLGRMIERDADGSCELLILHGTDGLLRAQIAVSDAEGQVRVFHFHHEVGRSGGWGFKLDPDEFDDLRKLYAATGEDD